MRRSSPSARSPSSWRASAASLLRAGAGRRIATLALLAALAPAGCSLLPTEDAQRAEAKAKAESETEAAAPGARAANAGAGTRAASGRRASAGAERRAVVEPIVVAPSRLPLPSIALEGVPEPPPDLLARLRAEFALPRIEDDDIERELAWYARNPDYIARVFERGRRYLHHIAEALAERGMPADLALLPVVESAFDPFAYSRGRASGLWQIIPGTGTRLGLKQNWWYDGRRDVVDSTRAALDYLELLHAQFNGDWLLAVAGYNSGEGNVARAIQKAEAQGRPTDFWSIRADLPAETRAYVPRLLAIRNLVAEPEAFELDLPAIEDAPYFAVVETEGQIDLALAAEIGALEIDALYALNPGINRWATDPDGPHRLVVPLGNAETFEAALAGLDAGERVRWSRHEIVRGETLIQIAARYQTTPDVLREINGITGNVIRAGDHLMIPHASAGRAAYSQSVEVRTALTQSRERDGARIDYRVEPGDSLWSIARRHGVDTAELASWNAMAPGDVLSVGRRLAIWSDSPAAAGIAAASPASLGPDQIRRVNYVVRRGDSLYSIAGRFRVTVDELIGWNGLSVDKYLQPGQSLVLYVDVTAQS